MQKKYHTMCPARVKKHTMKEFLEWLKEECLPGIWTKGVQASRSPKSIERISPDTDTRELRFTMATPERALAFRITLWPGEQDAHCDCGSKAEPCHHIVAVALAHSGGLVGTRSDAAESTPSIRLCYSWIYTKENPESLARISLKRSVKSGETESPVPHSLIAWVGGVKSGRIPGPLPHLTPSDLKLDELYARAAPSWPEVLRILSEFPPIPVEGHSEYDTLQALARPEPPELAITRIETGRWKIEPVRPVDREELEGGLFIRGGRVGAGSAESPFQIRILSQREIGPFLLTELPGLRDRFVIRDSHAHLPEVIEGKAELELKIESLPDERFSATARIRYAPLPAGAVLRSDPAGERELAREVRARLDLAIDQPHSFSAAGLLELRSRTFAWGAEGASLASALPQLETIRRILELKESRPGERRRAQALLMETLGTPLLDGDEKKNPALAIPSGLAPLLRKYQQDGARWLKHKWEALGGALLADDMGLGKTIQTLAVIEAPALVVVPASLLGNWKDEAAKFRPDLKVCLYHGSGRT
ncbi:MAG: hypothetical protein EBX52_10100, partial [Proteobacteria bacterium]|nr:hypothetical protein [Pseudomonadota bacterium]